ncbi:hypothetical protein [Candidatus Poriferisodalis sp.]|uniref:hypothetical protein n=1 Tax=Candidatus Poriferisodalis sp. TaxID=3101277 RepID=UPI003AF95C6D
MVKPFRLLLAGLAVATIAVTLAIPAGAQEPGVYLDGAEPWIASDCADDVPIVVSSDVRAQSDIYSAVTLAGVVGTDCIVLAGPRDGDMPATQRARLDAAAAGGYVLGGLTAVPAEKVANRGMTRIAEADRWATARLVGDEARVLAGGAPGNATLRDSTSTLPDDVREPGVYLDGAEPWIASDCAGAFPIVVGSDARAQSDIYSAVTLAGIVDTDCIVLAGSRDGPMPATQRARLEAAGARGCVLGGLAAVPAAKVAGRDMTRIEGADRWATARLVGSEARAMATCDGPNNNAPDTITPDSVSFWWGRPRGDLRVKIHVCTEPDLAQYFDLNSIVAVVSEANKQVAPFYAWQSSGLLNVEFETGDVVISELLSHGHDRNTYAPHDCLQHGPTDRAHIAHHYMLVYRNDLASSGIGGRARLHRGESVTYIPLGPHREPQLEILYSHLITVAHELDHNIGARHINGVLHGETRLGPGAFLGSGWKGSLVNFPESVQTDEVHFYFPCYYLNRQGWPVGESHPACALVPPPGPVDVNMLATLDGGTRLTWKPNTVSVNPEPVTGYVIKLREASQEEPIRIYSVSADTTTFVLPPESVASLEPGVVHALWVAADSAVGVGEEAYGGRFSYQDNDAQIRVIRRPNSGPMVFDVDWDPHPSADYYRIVGLERCTLDDVRIERNGSFWCGQRTENPSYVVHEQQGGHVVEGKSYEIIVFACGNDLVPFTVIQLPPAPSGCVRQGTATFVAEPWKPESIESVELTLIEGREWQSPDGTLAGRDYRAVWPTFPESSSYHLVAWYCMDEDAQSPCESEAYISAQSYEVSGNKVSAELSVEYGKHYFRIEAYFDCSPSAIPHLECRRNLYARSNVTILERSD